MLCKKDIVCGSIGLDMRLFGNCKYTVHQPLVQFRAHEDHVVQYISKQLNGALETTRQKQMKMNLFTSYQLDAVRAVEIATLSLMTGVKAMKELTDVGREVYKVVNGWNYIIVEITTLMTGVKASCLSLSLRAMGELTHVR